MILVPIFFWINLAGNISKHNVKLQGTKLPCADVYRRSYRITNYTLRDTSDNYTRTNYMKNSFSYSKAALWNSLPIEVQRAHALSQFKRYCGNFIYIYHGTRENQV